MAKQTYTTGQVLTAAQMTTLQANDYNQTISAKTGNYTLVAADAGTTITMTSASATALTVNTGVFTAGDTLEIINLGAGICTITAGTATVNTSAVLTLKQYDAGTLWFSATGTALFISADAADSPLTTKGDLFTYSTTNDRLAIGNNGETLVADSSTSTGLRWQAPKSLNGCVNGGFDIWQRGTSFAPSASTVSTYTADRWIFFRSGLALGATVSRQSAGSLGTTPAQSIQYAARIQRDSGNTNTGALQFTTSFESANSYQFAGQTVTLSFYARAGANFSAASSLFNVSLVTGTGTDQIVSNGFTGAATPISNTVTLTTSWQRFQATATLATTTTQIGVTSLWTPSGTAGANDWAEIAGVQVELGAIATPFQRTAGTIQGELAACQRYCFQDTDDSSTTGQVFAAMGMQTSTTAAVMYKSFPVQMRTVPTVTTSNLMLGDQIGFAAAATLTGSSMGYIGGNVRFSMAANGAQYRPIFLQYNDGASQTGFIRFEAEL